MKRSMWKVQEQIFQHQVRLLDHELLTGQSGDCRRHLSITSERRKLKNVVYYQIICAHVPLTVVKSKPAQVCVDLL